MNRIHRFISSALLVLVLGLSQTAVSQTSDREILATIGTRVITQQNLEEAMQGGDQEQYQLPEDRLDLLKELVRIVIFSDAAREEGIDDDPEVQRIINIIVNFHLARAYAEKHVKEAVQVSADEESAWYEKHQEEFIEPEKLSVRQIFLSQNPQLSSDESKKELAYQLLERVQQGEDFGSLSAAFSDDVELRKHAGALGSIARGALSPEYEDKVFSLDVGQISPVLEGEYGYAIFKIEGRTPATVIPFDEVRETVFERITQEKQDERFLEIEKELYQKFQVQLFEDRVQ